MHPASSFLLALLGCTLIAATPDGVAQQLIPNNGFEQTPGGWSTFLPGESAGKGAAFTVSTDNPRSGSKAAKLSSTDLVRFGIMNRSAYNTVAVTPGERYRVGGWVRAEPGTQVQSGTPGVLIRLTLSDASGNDAPGGHYMIGFDKWVGRDLVPPANGRLPGEWTKIEAVVEIPADTAAVLPNFFVWRTDGNVYFDDLFFEKVPASTPLTPISTSRAFNPENAPEPSAPAATELLTAEKLQELFAALDLDLPELAAVKTAVNANNMPAATAAFANYLRGRSGDYWLLPVFDPASPETGTTYNAERAQNARIGKVSPSGLATLWHTFNDNVFDWYHNETLYNPVAYNREWQWQLNRMSFWADMANAYRATADETYPQAWETQFRSFIAQCPPPSVAANYEFSTWRTIEAGIRTRDSWPRTYQAFVRSPSVSDEALLLLVHANLQHANYLRQYPSVWGNWLTMEMCGLYTIGSLFPEFKDAEQWRQTAITTLQDSAGTQFLPDGAQYELTPGYHIVALDQNLMAIPRLARVTGNLSEIPEDYIVTMEHGYDYLLYLMTPDRDLPRPNDSWPVAWLRGIFNNGLIFFPERNDWRWVATDGAQGTPPAYTSYAFPYAGYYVMRSGWETDANYLMFDAGPLGYAHHHQDKLNLVMWAYGKEILFDSGGGSYEWSKWRTYSSDTYSHNTVLVDGKPQHRFRGDMGQLVATEANDVIWESTAQSDFAVGTYDGPYSKAGYNGSQQPDGPAKHVRRVFFAKPDVVVVADTLIPQDSAPHSYEARWHLLPTQTVLDTTTLSVTTTAPGQPNLVVLPLHTDGLVVDAVSGQEEPELLGWNIRKDMTPQYVPATTVLHRVEGSGPKTLLTLLYPLRTGETNPVESVTKLNATQTRVSFNNGDALLITVDPAADGPISVVRE